MFIICALFVIGCISTESTGSSTNTPILTERSPISATISSNPSSIPQPTASFIPTNFKFPDSIDPARRYLFYLHGKIIEDHGIPAISTEYGEYEYEQILKTLSGHDFIVISEQRPKNTDGAEYSKRITQQVTRLLQAGVPAKNITIVGASKGAGIAIYTSHFLQNEDVNFVIMAICHPDTVEVFKQDRINLSGNVLSIYDSADDFAGPCQELFSYSEGKGISRYDEVVLDIGTGHGILYKPLDEWILPVVQWASSY